MTIAPMSINPISAVPRVNSPVPMTGTGTTGTGNTAGSSTTTAAPSGGELDREAFLKLLVAQLKYQDPSSPMDASAMISQSSQLTMVDKLDEMADMLTLSATTNQLMLAGSVVGKQITFTDPDGAQQSGVVASVRFNNGQLVLSIPNWDVPMGSVESIGTPPVAATDTTTGTTTGTTGSNTSSTPTIAGTADTGTADTSGTADTIGTADTSGTADTTTTDPFAP